MPKPPSCPYCNGSEFMPITPSWLSALCNTESWRCNRCGATCTYGTRWAIWSFLAFVSTLAWLLVTDVLLDAVLGDRLPLIRYAIVWLPLVFVLTRSLNWKYFRTIQCKPAADPTRQENS